MPTAGLVEATPLVGRMEEMSPVMKMAETKRMEAKNHRWILVLEDDEDDLSLTMRALTRIASDLNVRIASDGEEAMAILNGPDLPSLVIMDAHMPKLSGGEVLRRAMQNRRLAGIPFVVFSSSIAPHEVRELMDEGATDIVTKPLDYSDYASALKLVIDRYS